LRHAAKIINWSAYYGDIYNRAPSGQRSLARQGGPGGN
jgi:hypothetical protein